MALIFLPKVNKNNYTKTHFKRKFVQVIAVLSRANDKAESKYNHDERPSKEDEERYQRLLSDNEDLQRLISQVSQYSPPKSKCKSMKFYAERRKNQAFKGQTARQRKGH